MNALQAFVDSVKMLSRVAAAFFWSFIIAFMIVLWGILFMLFWRKK